MYIFQVTNHVFKMIWGIISLYLPIRKNIVCFDSFGGQYNDNPKYISEELHKQRPDIKIVWNHSDKGHDVLPSYIQTVDNSSYIGRLLFNSAQVVVDNHTGIRSGKCPKNNTFYNLYYKLKNKKRVGQFCISTFHGTPLKKIAMDEPNARNEFNFYSSTNYVLSGCKYTTEHFNTAFNNSIEIREYGTPRNDLLLNDGVCISEIKRKLGLPLDAKIILYAPTFRKNIEISGLSQMNQLNINDIIKALSSVIGGNRWAFVFRAHNLVMKKIDFQFIQNRTPNVILINGNLHDDMAEYLKCTDVLISDYSASIFDFALTRRPCFLYVPDLQEYGNTERGFYRDIESLPFPAAKNNEDLISLINQYRGDEYKQRINSFLEEIGNLENGHASERVVKDIISYIDNNNEI